MVRDIEFPARQSFFPTFNFVIVSWLIHVTAYGESGSILKNIVKYYTKRYQVHRLPQWNWNTVENGVSLYPINKQKISDLVSATLKYCWKENQLTIYIFSIKNVSLWSKKSDWQALKVFSQKSVRFQKNLRLPFCCCIFCDFGCLSFDPTCKICWWDGSGLTFVDIPYLATWDRLVHSWIFTCYHRETQDQAISW